MGSFLVRSFAVAILLAGIHSAVGQAQHMFEVTRSAVMQHELELVLKAVRNDILLTRAEGRSPCQEEIRGLLIKEIKDARHG